MLDKIKAVIPDRKQNWLMFFFSVITFSIVFVTDTSSLMNAFVIYLCEFCFLTLYLLFLREFPPFIALFKQNKLVGLVFLFWVLSISISLYSSPYNLAASHLAVGRYLQTITHIITFLFVWDFLTRYQPSLKLLFYAISLSTIGIVIAFFVEWLINSPLLGEKLIAELWFYNPPFNSHIRHAGYQAVAALTFSLVLFIDNVRFSYRQVANFIMFSILWGFVFCLGGRGAALSILVTTVLVLGVLRLKNMDSKTFAISTMLAIILGLILSEWASIGSWSSMLNALQRSLEAESFNQLSSNRLKLWLSAWQSVKNHLLFGLGPQGYLLMPNHIFGVHPHNIIVQFVVEWGVSGTVLFLFLLIKGFWVGLKRNVLETGKSINKYKLVAGAVITTLSIHALFDGTYYHPQPSIYLAIAFAIWITPSYEDKAKQV